MSIFTNYGGNTDTVIKEGDFEVLNDLNLIRENIIRGYYWG